MADETPVTRFKRELRQESRDRGFVKLVDLERKTGLSHSTMSNAFNEARSMPSTSSVHTVVQAWAGDTEGWERRRRAALAAVSGRSSEPDDAPSVPVETVPVETSVAGSEPSPRAPSDPASPPSEPSPGIPIPLEPPAEAIHATRDQSSVFARRRLVAGSAIVLLVVVLGAGLRLVTSSGGRSTRQPLQSDRTADQSPVQTFLETVIPENAVRTLADPLTAQGLGASIPAGTTVEVSCRVYSPEIPSALPDGYFYRVESDPWDGRFYAAANSFLNGDPPGQVDQYVTPTDLSVPVCEGDGDATP